MKHEDLIKFLADLHNEYRKGMKEISMLQGILLQKVMLLDNLMKPLVSEERQKEAMKEVGEQIGRMKAKLDYAKENSDEIFEEFTAAGSLERYGVTFDDDHEY